MEHLILTGNEAGRNFSRPIRYRIGVLRPVALFSTAVRHLPKIFRNIKINKIRMMKDDRLD